VDTSWVAPVTTLAAGLGGSLGGYWVAGRNEEKRDNRAARRDDLRIREASVQARRKAAREELEELQVAVQEYARVANEALLFHVGHALEGWNPTPLRGDLAASLEHARLQMIRLRTRVDLGGSHTILRLVEGATTIAASRAELGGAPRAIEEVMLGLQLSLALDADRALEEVGEAIRGLD
jgi:hypothetical protein